MVNFNFVNAQTVFTNYYLLARDHGDANDNWCSLEATAMLNNLLALDNATARSNFLTVYLTTGAARQDSLDYDYNRDYNNPGDIWNESLQYSTAVTTIRANNMVLIERYDPTRNLLNVYSNILSALPRAAQLVYPNKNDEPLFGDAHQGDGAAQSYDKLLKTQGYATMCIGKWHLGDQPKFFPMNHGFDHYFGLPYSNDMLRPEASDGKRVVPLLRDNQVIRLWSEGDQDQMTRLYTEEAVKFIQENRDHPFYLYLAHNAVHFPIHPGPEFRGKSGHGRYYDWVEEVDWSAGQVMQTLRQLHLETNTLVFFTSDNGPWLVHGADAGSAGPLRGGKGSTWEGGLRESTLAWWPGHIPAGRVTDAVAGEIDLLPTFVKLAGGTVPTDRPIDGADINQLLLGQSDVSAREAHYFYLGYKLQAVRSGPWKLALGPQGYSAGFKEDTTHQGEHKSGLRLYNLVADIGETTDVAAQQPEVFQKLKALADHEAASLCDGSPKGSGVRPPGRVDNPQFIYPVKPSVSEKRKKKSANKGDKLLGKSTL